MEIHLIRHTKVKLTDNVCYGQSDVELSPTFLQDISAVQLDTDYNAVYTSPLKRCTQLAAYFNFESIKEDRIQELNFGDWEMQQWEAIPKAEITPWYNDYLNVAPPNGENVITFRQRVLAFWEELVQKHENEKVLMITHSGVIRIILQYVFDFPLENMFIFQPQFGKKVILRFHASHWNLTSFNA